MSNLITYITLDEFQKLIKAEKKKEYKLAYILGFGSGLRISEVIGGKGKDERVIPALTIEKVSLQTHQIRIEGAKGNKDRITVTNPWLNETALKMLPLKLSRRTVQDRIHKLGIKELNRHDVHFHTLRHGFGNYMVNDKNVPLPMVQAMMGHSRLDTTGIYTKANPKQATDRAFEAWN